MTSWRGWVATQPSRLTWDEWRQYQQRRASGAMPVTPGTHELTDEPAVQALPELRIAALEELCSLLTVENAGLKTALDHWQRQPVAVG